MSKLELINVRKEFKDFSLNISFTLRDNELLAILGPSGGGKSTLLKLISGEETPDEGEIILDGKRINNLPIQKRNIGMVFQDYSLFSNMNVTKNIEYGMKEKDRKHKKEIVSRLLSMAGLDGYQKRKVTTLSGGEAQRVALLRSIASEPGLLLLDEPLSALDAPMRKKVRNEIRSLHDITGIPMLYVTHDREEAFSLSDRIILINEGRIVAEGTAEELYHNPNTLFTAFFLGEGTALPASLFYKDSQEDEKVFFRPEDVAIVENDISWADYPNHLVIKGAKIESAEFMGDGYTLGLSYCSYPILANSVLKPKTSIVDLLILKNSIKFLHS